MQKANIILHKTVRILRITWNVTGLNATVSPSTKRVGWGVVTEEYMYITRDLMDSIQKSKDF